MPTVSYFREKIIREVRATGTMTRRALLRKISGTNRAQANFQIGQLVSDGVLISTGIGRRGHPEIIGLSPIFSAMRCPFCLRELDAPVPGIAPYVCDPSS
jgi:hypothetical protein